jgi:hypothetical protein
VEPLEVVVILVHLVFECLRVLVAGGAPYRPHQRQIRALFDLLKLPTHLEHLQIRQAAEHFSRDGKRLSRAEALDERGIIRDGVIARTRMTMRDSAHRFTDARRFWDANRDTLLVTDARALGGTEGNKPGWRVADSPINQQAIADAHAAYEDDLVNAWKNPLGFGSIEQRGSQERDPDTTDGWPLEFRRSADGSITQMMQDHRRRMDQLYADYERELTQAWRRGK